MRAKPDLHTDLLWSQWNGPDLWSPRYGFLQKASTPNLTLCGAGAMLSTSPRHDSELQGIHAKSITLPPSIMPHSYHLTHSTSPQHAWQERRNKTEFLPHPWCLNLKRWRLLIGYHCWATGTNQAEDLTTNPEDWGNELHSTALWHTNWGFKH